ncbi:MAG TPA: hypothetical protein VFS43_28935 [Polyangiaceae bacterium]|nr:hypothetical protein [Polyangiaceae bacterium]
MRAILLDADAFRCLHGLKLLDVVLEALASRTPVVVTEYVARHELSLLGLQVTRLEAAGVLSVRQVLKGTPAGQRFREFQRAAARGELAADKGEAEAVAWALDEPWEGRALFVTRDDGAQKFARGHRVPVTDVMGVVVEACEVGGLAREVAASALAGWDDPEQQLCRPARYAGFDAAYAERLEQRKAWATEQPSKTSPA